jgi:hypothetical protein
MVNRLFFWIFSSIARIKSSLTTDGRPLHGSSCTFSRPSLKCLTHLLTIESLMACSPYTCQPVSCFLHSRNGLLTAFHMWWASQFSWTLWTHRTMRKHGSIACKLRLCLPKPKGPTKSASMHTIVTTALQRQYLQTELILWICLVDGSSLFQHQMWILQHQSWNFIATPLVSTLLSNCHQRKCPLN